MGRRVLITGGAGFVGSHLADALLKDGCAVRALDSLAPLVHGRTRKPPAYLAKDVAFVRGDLRDRDAVRKAIRGVSVISHQAAAVSVAQSMYEIADYVEANSFGTAVLLDVLANEKHRVEKLVVASSVTIYGEGAYRCSRCGPVYPKVRPPSQLQARQWEMRCPSCGRPAQAIPTNEDCPLHPTSIYAITKRDQEEMCLTIGRAYGIPTVVLRYFNIYGPRQALSNPYAGVAAIFSARLLSGQPPVIYEDGLQSRDFIHVSDIVQANLLAMKSHRADYHALNVGTGVATSVRRVAELLIRQLGSDQAPELPGKFRPGDTRHCFADLTRIRQTLGFQPKVKFEDGIDELVEWVKEQSAVVSKRKLTSAFDKMKREMAKKKMAR